VSKKTNPYAALTRIFHEPNRLAIMSVLCNAEEGLTFNALKEECDLTDGNLSRHLKTLEETKAIRIRKSFVKGKPQTTIYLTERGRQNFIDYLEALKLALQKAAESLAQEKETALPLSLSRLLQA
jgi:DNA-binding HxlR family transcriptional regulator